MRKLIALSALLSLPCLLVGPSASSSQVRAAAQAPDQYGQYPGPANGQYPDPGAYEPYSADQLDNLLAPIALYPDPLIAQVLLAATFPDQVQDAAQWIRNNDPNFVDDQPWDVSVRAVAHYPTVLSMLNDTIDWTTALGQAYVYQSTDVMMSVQRLRGLAYSQGNLVTTQQQQVIMSGGYIQIVPAQPRVIYVPVYDPGVIYVRNVYRPGIGFGASFSFGSGFVIGTWLNYDLDWGGRRVVYENWNAPVGWRARSVPYVHVTNVYVNNRYETVNVNRTVVQRPVDYNKVNRYNSVHRDVTYENQARVQSNRNGNQPPRNGGQPQQRPNDGNFGRSSQPPPNTQAPANNQRGNDRGNGQGNNGQGNNPPTNNQRGVGNQPPARAEQPVRPAPQPPPAAIAPPPAAVNQPQSQPPNQRGNDRGNGAGNDRGNFPGNGQGNNGRGNNPPTNNQRGVGNQPPVRTEQPARPVPQPPPAAIAPPPAANQPPNQPRSQPPNDRSNERVNDRGAARPAPQPQAPPAAAARPSNETKPKAEPQHDDKNKGKGKDDDKK